MARCDFDPDDLHTRLRIRVPGRLDALSPAVDRIMAEARQMECSRGKEFEIETALREALANAIRHGCGHDQTKSVEVCVACDESKGMLIVVRDPGPGFDPAQVVSFTIDPSLSGRSQVAIRQLLAQVERELGALPGVTAVSLADEPLLTGNASQRTVRVQG